MESETYPIFSFSSSFFGKFFSSPNNENKQEAVGKQTIYKYPKDAPDAHLTDTIRFLIARHFHLFAYLR